MKFTHPKWVLWPMIIAVFMLAAASALIAFVLPVYVEKELIPGLASQFGLTPEQVRVRRIGWWGTDLGPIRLSANDAPAVAVAAVQVDYSPLSLLRGRIKGIVLGGLGIEMSVTSEGVVIAGGLRPAHPTAPASGPSGPSELDLKTLLPVKLDRLAILTSHLTVNQNNRRHDIPFEIEMDTHQLSAGLLKTKVSAVIAGHPLTLTASIDQSANSAGVDFNVRDVLLQRISQFIRMPAEINLEGTMDLGGRGTFELQPFKLNRLSISGQIRNTLLAAPHGALVNMAPDPGDPQPIQLSIQGDSLDKLQWRCEPFRIDSFAYMEVNGFRGGLAYTHGNWSLTGIIKTIIPKQQMPGKGDLETDVAMDWEMTAHGDGSGNDIAFGLRGHSDRPLKAAMAGRQLASRKHEINVSGHFRNGALTARGDFTTGEITLQRPEGKMSAPSVKAGGTVTIPATDGGAPSLFTAHAALPDVRSKWGTTTVHLPKIAVQASGEGKPHQPWVFDARLDISDGRVADLSKGIKLSNISMALPLKWPDAAASEAGNVKINTILWKNREMGGLKGVLQQTREGMALEVRHTSKLFPGLRVLFNGGIDRSGASLVAEIPAYRMVDEIDLGQFIPEAAGFRVTGQVASSGRLTADGGGVKASGRFKFNQGRLHEETRGFLLEGIDMDIQMDDLFEIKSAPQQRLRIDHMAMGNLMADHLEVDFQIEDGRTLFVEKAGIDWSRGKINTSSIRVIAGKADYDVTLFCDRLNLAMVLEQLGVAEGGGEGTVSGRIPVRWTQGRLSFDNGFLYSAPGQSGSIQLTGTQKLLAELPPESPQFTQVDIATEALKDYIYQWAKLNLLSEGENLLLKLQLDGKPNRLMPFAYDPSLGQFKRVAGEGQADFKGIRIDLNFSSPMNDIINYKDLLNQEN